MTATIRRASTGDATIMALLGRITFAETFGPLFQAHPGDLRGYLDTTFDVTKIERSLAKPDNAYWLAFQDRLPVGYAKLKHPSPIPIGTASDVAPPNGEAPNAAQLQKIYVLGAFLTEGVGYRLLQAVLPDSARKAPMLWLEVLRENRRAIDFYARNGFTKIGEDNFAIGVQHFQFDLMARASS